MSENWQEQKLEHDELDRELDAALAQYAAVEPRAGLENRVLSHLRAERDQREARSWWRWPAVAALAAAVVAVALALAWRSAGPTRHVANRNAPPVTHIDERSGVPAESPVRAPSHDRGRPERRIPATPRLDQFPSLQPLSEQEKILASYVEQFREQAVMVARVRTEELQQERVEYLQDLQHSAESSGSDLRSNHDTNQ